MKYIRYQLEYRKYSSNCIVGIYTVLNSNTGKLDEVKDKLLAPFLPKKEGDILANNLLSYLNSTL